MHEIYDKENWIIRGCKFPVGYEIKSFSEFKRLMSNSRNIKDLKGKAKEKALRDDWDFFKTLGSGQTEQSDTDNE